LFRDSGGTPQNESQREHVDSAQTTKSSSAKATETMSSPSQFNSIPAPEDVAEVPSQATKTASGLAYRILKPGTSDLHPDPEIDSVEVHYTGWTTNGQMFDSSVVRGQPATFPLNRVIKGWTEGVALMTVGELRRFWIPAHLAYGDHPPPGAPAGMLVFDVELRAIIKGKPPIAAPKDVAEPPSQAQKTTSGLRYHVLQAGTGKQHPLASDRVEVHYTGWTTDGKMFDSSVQRGQTATFPLNQVIPGWTEGVSLMVEGETTRFWIPSELAYNNQPGRPQGTLVFDIELIRIHKN
jgi:peptidylprolyl isomerase